MTLSWKELVCHGLLKEFGEPSLVKEILKLSVKEHRDYLDEEARVFYYGQIQFIHERMVDCYKRNIILTGPESEIKKYRPHYKTMHELTSTWKERGPCFWRGAVARRKASLLRGDGPVPPYDPLSEEQISHRKIVKWYEEIHEGRYYLFVRQSYDPDRDRRDGVQQLFLMVNDEEKKHIDDIFS